MFTASARWLTTKGRLTYAKSYRKTSIVTWHNCLFFIIIAFFTSCRPLDLIALQELEYTKNKRDAALIRVKSTYLLIYILATCARMHEQLFSRCVTGWIMNVTKEPKYSTRGNTMLAIVQEECLRYYIISYALIDNTIAAINLFVSFVKGFWMWWASVSQTHAWPWVTFAHFEWSGRTHQPM